VIAAINLTMKFKWMEKHWGHEESLMAERYVEEAVSVAPTCLSHKRMILMFAQMLLHLQAQATEQVLSYTTSKAAYAQIQGFVHLESLNITHHTPSLPSMLQSQITTPSVLS
jgi:hypothetical protein